MRISRPLALPTGRTCLAFLAASIALPAPAQPPAPPVSLGPPTVDPRSLPQAGAALPVPPFGDRKELSAEALVQEVVARNPSLAQMIAAWQAASARYPQVTSLDAPMFGVQLAPGAWGSRDLDG